MGSFKKRNYTIPVICRHESDLSKDWYVFFQYKNEGKIYTYKRREGINRIKDLKQRIKETKALVKDLLYDLENGWNPTLDKKREINYNPYLVPKINSKKNIRKTKTAIALRYYLK